MISEKLKFEKDQYAVIDESTRQKVFEALPVVIMDKTRRDGRVNFSLFKSTITNGKVKLIPYGNVRTPYLINNSMLSGDIAEEISQKTQLPLNDVDQVVRSIAIEAQEALKSSSCYTIKGLCRVYLDAGKIRISTRL